MDHCTVMDERTHALYGLPVVYSQQNHPQAGRLYNAIHSSTLFLPLFSALPLQLSLCSILATVYYLNYAASSVAYCTAGLESPTDVWYMINRNLLDSFGKYPAIATLLLYTDLWLLPLLSTQRSELVSRSVSRKTKRERPINLQTLLLILIPFSMQTCRVIRECKKISGHHRWRDSMLYHHRQWITTAWMVYCCDNIMRARVHLKSSSFQSSVPPPPTYKLLLLLQLLLWQSESKCDVEQSSKQSEPDKSIVSRRTTRVGRTRRRPLQITKRSEHSTRWRLTNNHHNWITQRERGEVAGGLEIDLDSLGLCICVSVVRCNWWTGTL